MARAERGIKVTWSGDWKPTGNGGEMIRAVVGRKDSGWFDAGIEYKDRPAHGRPAESGFNWNGSGLKENIAKMVAPRYVSNRLELRGDYPTGDGERGFLHEKPLSDAAGFEEREKKFIDNKTEAIRGPQVPPAAATPQEQHSRPQHSAAAQWGAKNTESVKRPTQKIGPPTQ